MIDEHHEFNRVLILSDELANWQIAGLRQFDRLVLEFDEFAKAMGAANGIGVIVFWKLEVLLSKRFLFRY